MKIYYKEKNVCSPWFLNIFKHHFNIIYYNRLPKIPREWNVKFLFEEQDILFCKKVNFLMFHIFTHIKYF